MSQRVLGVERFNFMGRSGTLVVRLARYDMHPRKKMRVGEPIKNVFGGSEIGGIRQGRATPLCGF